MVVAGLTGGIATGKSTVTTVLDSLGAAVIDADRIAREVVRRGRPAWEKIVDHFGRQVLLPDGEIDRDLLGGIIFGDVRQRGALDRIVHPEVFREMDRRIRELRTDGRTRVVVCDVPLLIETGAYRAYEEVILVYVPEPLQVRRLMDRDRITGEEALRKVRSQMPIEDKKAYATIVIDNSGSRGETEEKTGDAYRRLVERSGQGDP